MRALKAIETTIAEVREDALDTRDEVSKVRELAPGISC